MVKIAQLLEWSESTYFQAFNQMVCHVEESLEEAQDVWMHLKLVQRYFEDMESTEYGELEQVIAATIHLICLIWANSAHYRQPAFIVTLFREFSNYIIELVCYTTLFVIVKFVFIQFCNLDESICRTR